MLNGQADPIDAHKDFHHTFEKEKEKILGDGDLQKISQQIVGGVASIKSFQDILEKFPEISAEKEKSIFGLEIVVVTTADNKKEGLKLLRLLGFPIKP